MATKRSGLGRGLESLFADTSGGLGTSYDNPLSLPLRDIEPDKDQPRKAFENQSLTELAKSIEDHGVLQPIIVRPSPSGTYIIVAGERRWRAARMAGLRDIPVVIREVSEFTAMEMALIENLQREDLDPIEEALGYKQLMDRCSLTQEQVARKLAKSRSAVANSLRILSLPEEVLDMIKEGNLTAGHAKAILAIPDAKAQKEAAALILKEHMNVREAENLSRKMQRKKKTAPKPMARPSIAAEVEISLREVLGTEVRVEYHEGNGNLVVGFYSDEQLRAFANLLGGYKVERPKQTAKHIELPKREA